MQIHIARDGKQLGPFSLDEVKRQLAAGTLSLSDNAWYEGAAGWAPLSSVPGITGAGPASPAATPSAPMAASAPGGPVAPAPIPSAPTEPLAIWSFVLSLVAFLGFCCGGPILGIGAIVCGHLAISKINANPQLQGRGLAVAGLIIGYTAVVCWVFYLLFFGGITALQGILEATRK